MQTNSLSRQRHKEKEQDKLTRSVFSMISLNSQVKLLAQSRKVLHLIL